jgi:hypothetical protein
MRNSVTITAFLLSTAAGAAPLDAQHTHGKHGRDSSQIIGAADAAMSGPMSEAAKKHMELSPARKPTRADSARAMKVAQQLRAALHKYHDTTAAVADGYRMFMPNVKTQRVFHFTNHRNAFMEAFRFDVAQPTSLLYQRGPDGGLRLIGAMYSAPKRMRAGKLDERVPLSIARWHKHVNWCLPPKEQPALWLERRNGMPLFGPESPIATKSECEKIGGQFHENLFGWMVHANVFLGEDLATVFGHEH